MDSPDAPGGFGVRNVDFSFGVHQILRDVTFSVRPGEIHALVGRHNEGKSTLCGILTGRLAPDSGEVLAGGKSFPALKPGQARDLGIAGLSNSPRVYPRGTVLENLVAGDRSRWMGLFPGRNQRRRVGEWLEANRIELPLAAAMHEIPRELWVVVETLSKLYQTPRLLVMDEALEELKQPWFNQLLSLIKKHRAGGMGLLVVTHKIEDALNMADRVTVMRRGHVILSNSASNMERLNLIRLCYAQLDGYDENFASQEKFHEMLRYTEAMLRDLPTAVIILATNLHIRFLNRAGQRIFADALKKGGDLFGGENARLRQAIQAAGETGQASEHHAIPIVSGDRRIIADVRIQAILENNVKVGTMLVIEDVSLREELRRRLLLSEQLESIGLLAAGVAHEVNNPLEIIGNYLHYLRDDPASPDFPEVVSRMEDELARIQEIVRNLVAGSGKKDEGEIVDVMAMAKDISGLLKFHGGFRSVDFVCEAPADEVLLHISQSELRQIFLNLIRNSLDAMGEGGKIRIGAEIADDEGAPRVVVKVADNGPGIQLDNPNDVFLPFVSTKKGGGGHQGLGLYIVYGIIKKYDGSIRVANLPEGGCEFRLTFPLAGRERRG